MRYLGKVLQSLDEILYFEKSTNTTVTRKSTEKDETPNMLALQTSGDFKHLRTLLEKEIVLRSAKHVFNRILKEEKGESDLYLADVVSHLLNCLFAPHDFLTRLDQGNLRQVDSSIQSEFQFRPGEIVPSPRKNSNVQELDGDKKVDEKSVTVSAFSQDNTQSQTSASVSAASQQQQQQPK